MFGALNREFDTIDSVYQALTNNGSDSTFTSGMAARGIFKSLDVLRNADAQMMNKQSLTTLKKLGRVGGLGDKTMSMAIALFDSTNPVFTLDVHMLRGLQRLHNGQVAGSMTIGSKDYVNLENWLVATLTNLFPNVDIFTIQWALWNRWGFGVHKCHTAIFGHGV
jgi:hypothetical protein